MHRHRANLDEDGTVWKVGNREGSSERTLAVCA